MIDKQKTDVCLGLQVRDYLIETGVETPMKPNSVLMKDKKLLIEKAMSDIMKVLGLSLDDDSLKETPRRIAKMYLEEIFAGLDYSNFPKVTTIENKMNYSTFLLERHIAVKSVCEHHFVAFMGEAYVAYIPDKKVIGLSKINRIVEFFCRRPQVQERLTEQIFHTLCYVLETNNVAVIIKAEHFCVKLRGAEDVNSDTITTKLGGAFYEKEPLRNEFYHAVEL